MHRTRRHHLTLLLAIGLGLSASPSARAQDQHYSMLDLDPLLFNPAYSGFFNGSSRFGVVYRNQWASVSKPFQTLSATTEVAFARGAKQRNGLNGGLWLSADRAGSLAYGTTAASAIVSYFQGLADGNHILSLGLEAGVGQVGFDEEGLQLADAAEGFSSTHALYPTLGAGLAWFWQVSEQLYTKAAIAARNINEPNISHLDIASDARLSRRFSLYMRAEYRPWSRWSLLPLLGYQHQRGFSEAVYGCDARFYLREDPRDYLALSGGITARHADAAALNMAVLWHEWTFAFCYDANISQLSQASHTIGAFEVGVVYMAAPHRPASRAALPCPIF